MDIRISRSKYDLYCLLLDLHKKYRKPSIVIGTNGDTCFGSHEELCIDDYIKNYLYNVNKIIDIGKVLDNYIYNIEDPDNIILGHGTDYLVNNVLSSRHQLKYIIDYLKYNAITDNYFNEHIINNIKTVRIIENQLWNDSFYKLWLIKKFEYGGIYMNDIITLFLNQMMHVLRYEFEEILTQYFEDIGS